MLQHVSIEIPPAEADRMVEFWEAIGFKRVDAPGPLRDYVTWLEREGTQIHLIHSEEATVPPLGHAAVVAPGFDSVVARVRAAGFDVEDHRELWGARRSFAIGPAGHRVELMEEPPPRSA
ncbi:MAG TPA: VOC family protein [Solirubrobacterales bacterium]|nr:VOC family protein [Solirubrobacterales bacterium]